MIYTQTLDEGGNLLYQGQTKKNPGDASGKSCYHGHGKLFYRNGALSYEGQLKNGRCHALGKEGNKPPGHWLKYAGDFRYGRIHGVATQYN